MTSTRVAKLLLIIKGVRTVAAWTVIPACLSFIVAENELATRFPGGAWPSWAARPAAFEWILWWRNSSIEIALACGLISLPRWQSLAGLALALGALCWAVTGY
jgi:hypothetical protein